MMIFPVKVPYTVSADISKYQGAPFNVHPDQFYIDQNKNISSIDYQIVTKYLLNIFILF